MLIKLRLVARLDFGLNVPMLWSGGCSKHTFRLDQTSDRISPFLPTPHAYHIYVGERMESSPTGCPVCLDKLELTVTMVT